MQWGLQKQAATRGQGRDTRPCWTLKKARALPLHARGHLLPPSPERFTAHQHVCYTHNSHISAVPTVHSSWHTAEGGSRDLGWWKKRCGHERQSRSTGFPVCSRIGVAREGSPTKPASIQEPPCARGGGQGSWVAGGLTGRGEALCSMARCPGSEPHAGGWGPPGPSLSASSSRRAQLSWDMQKPAGPRRITNLPVWAIPKSTECVENSACANGLPN